MASTDPSAPKGEQESEESKQSTADMTTFVQNLLMQMQTRFQAMSESIISKIDEMGSRIDELEKSINDLKAEMETESGPKFQELHCNTGIVHGPSGILA
ncbi:heat shock factor-binding protein 1-like isoform X1 [Ananas comosus]|uniref:Heat shock factor-binding protein 1-like isoform X1 n=1 Tax=Ananas comosus TaxID=4615 RepID=A0A6P5EWX1_ANACO|nr:heat shock factor-binding protein 1-like isoform X1 [Ananas comosus]